ncbi:MAG: hypothetical protein LAT57_10955 [Balneolales bacterium]|nr:hypothetical protein [Balneolales bacterium]
MDQSQTEFKKNIIDAALIIYMEDRTRFTWRNIATAAGCEVSEIQQFYPGKQAILRAFYDMIPQIFEAMRDEIPEYESLNFGEKVSNYIYTTFDVLNEHRDFVEETYDAMVFRRDKTGWHTSSEAIFKSFIESDERIPDANRLLIQDFMYKMLVREYHQLIRFWIHDDSEGSERTLALVDKLTSFSNELIYSGIVDKGFDLAKYLISQDIWKFRFSEVFAGIDQLKDFATVSAGRFNNDIESAINRVRRDIKCGSLTSGSSADISTAEKTSRTASKSSKTATGATVEKAADSATASPEANQTTKSTSKSTAKTATDSKVDAPKETKPNSAFETATKPPAKPDTSSPDSSKTTSDHTNTSPNTENE